MTKEELRTAARQAPVIMDYLRSKGLEHWQPVSELAMVEHEARDAESKELFKEPLPDMLLRQQVNEIANRLFVHHNVCTQWTEVVIRFSPEEIRRMDRREFRQHLSRDLNRAGDALMAAWEQLHREQP